VKLLRFLQEHKVERVGGREGIPVDVRVLCATNRDLAKAIEDGLFREDLYYRLGVVTITVPPLRDREADIVLLAKAFLTEFSRQHKKKIKGFQMDALSALRSYHWPGNVRELENKVKRAVIIGEGKFVSSKDLELATLSGTTFAKPLKTFREEQEREYIEQMLSECGWNISQAARRLGISRPTLHDMIKKYKIHLDKQG